MRALGTVRVKDGRLQRWNGEKWENIVPPAPMLWRRPDWRVKGE